LAGCQKLKPESVSIPNYPDLNQLYKDQIQKLNSRGLIKEVSLDAQNEKHTFQMDTTRWAKELSFFEEIDPNQPQYVGVFEVIENEDQIELTLKKGEKGMLQYLIISKSEDGFKSIDAIWHEEKDVYIYYQEIQVSFRNNLMDNFEIRGYQKMMFKDTVRFSIKGIITD